MELTHREFMLLAEMMQRPGHVFTRQQLLNRVWGYDYIGDERTVDVTVRRLRKVGAQSGSAGVSTPKGVSAIISSEGIPLKACSGRSS